jgi:hypothetical protein
VLDGSIGIPWCHELLLVGAQVIGANFAIIVLEECEDFPDGDVGELEYQVLQRTDVDYWDCLDDLGLELEVQAVGFAVLAVLHPRRRDFPTVSILLQHLHLHSLGCLGAGLGSRKLVLLVVRGILLRA